MPATIEEVLSLFNKSFYQEMCENNIFRSAVWTEQGSFSTLSRATSVY